MKTYALSLHGKQGDDFSAHLEDSRTVSDALRSWAVDHGRRRDACEQIARVLEGKAVAAQADTHMILLTPEDEEATSALDALVAEEILSVEFEEEEEDEGDDEGEE